MESMVKPTAMVEVPGYGTFEIGEYGKPDGDPYFFIPGFLGSLHQAMLLDHDAKQLNMRIIGINKPGVGHSPFREVHSAREFGSAVLHLADAMHIGSIYTTPELAQATWFVGRVTTAGCGTLRTGI